MYRSRYSLKEMVVCKRRARANRRRWYCNFLCLFIMQINSRGYRLNLIHQRSLSRIGRRLTDRVWRFSRSRKTDRRYSRSSSASESSNMSSEIHGLSSTTSTPSLSRHSSNERINKSGIKVNAEGFHGTQIFEKKLAEWNCGVHLQW